MTNPAPRTPNTEKPSPPRKATTAPTQTTPDPATTPKPVGPTTNGNNSTKSEPNQPAPRTSLEVIVLGKPTVHQKEIQHLRAFGHALALRGNQLVTTRSKGAPAEVGIGFVEGGGTIRYLEKDEQPGERPVVIFTNSKMQENLDKEKPGWREKGWVIINNPKETEDAANYARIIAKERGTPLPD